jgi:microcystin-dependent protein
VGTPYLAEIKIISWNFAPKGWAFCNGQLLPINQNQALFSILGTTYGGDGRVNFALPDLRGRVPVHVGSSVSLGQVGGQEFHTVITSEMPAHTHTVKASNVHASLDDPTDAYWAGVTSGTNYSTGAPSTTMNPAVISAVGGSQPHENRQPFLVLNFVIALQGIFPSQN